MSRFQISSNTTKYSLDNLVNSGMTEFYWKASSFMSPVNIGDKVFIIRNDNTSDSCLKYIASIQKINIPCKSVTAYENLSDFRFNKGKGYITDVQDAINKDGVYYVHKLLLEYSIDEPKLNKRGLFSLGLPQANGGHFQQHGCNDVSNNGKNAAFFDNVLSVLRANPSCLKQLSPGATLGSQFKGSGGSSSDMNTIIAKALQRKKQIVLTGAPGTGKTYSVLKYVKTQTGNDKKRYEFVQFHPSYDYSDFVEGLRPVVMKPYTVASTSGATSVKEEISFAKLDGIFKGFCRHIVTENFDNAFPSFKSLSGAAKQSKYDKVFAKIMEKGNHESKDNEILLNEKEPQDFCYDNDAIDKFKNGIGEEYYFIIDEINRADLSKVFGELMFGLEEAYRGVKHGFKTQYSNLTTYKTASDGLAEKMEFDCFKNGFFIPQNLYIIGTMNDIDKSVEAFDFALRRRFEWIDIKANTVMDDGLKGILSPSVWAGKNNERNDLANRIKAMNEVISSDSYGGKYGLSDAYHIGHAYFKNVTIDAKTGDFYSSLKDVYDSNVTSIIKEYLRGRKKEDIDSIIKACRDALGIKEE